MVFLIPVFCPLLYFLWYLFCLMLISYSYSFVFLSYAYFIFIFISVTFFPLKFIFWFLPAHILFTSSRFLPHLPWILTLYSVVFSLLCYHTDDYLIKLKKCMAKYWLTIFIDQMATFWRVLCLLVSFTNFFGRISFCIAFPIPFWLFIIEWAGFFTTSFLQEVL